MVIAQVWFRTLHPCGPRERARDWEHVTNALPTLSLVEKAKPVQVHCFTLRLREQWSECVNARCMESLHGFLCGIEWMKFAWSLDRFQKTSLGGRSNTKLGDHGSPNVPNHYLFLLVYHGGGPAWTKIHRNSICLRAQSRMNLDGTWGSVTSLHDFGGVLIGPWTLLFGLTQFQTISWSWLLVCVWNGPK